MAINKTTKPVKGKTQRHHIIPRAYFERRNLPVDNSANNLVNLPVIDHVRAHLYMMKAATSKEMRSINAAAVKITCDTLDLEVLQEREAVLEEAFLVAAEAKSAWMREVRKRQKTGWGACRVVCVETGQIYNSIAEAERLTGLSISECLRGKFSQAGGYHWKYVDKPTPEYIPKIVRFTNPELEILRKEYPTQGANIPELLVRHSPENIYCKAHALGICREGDWRSQR